jgi:hypothetical protein
LQNARFALFTALARPDRIVRALPEAPVAIVHAPDHGPVSADLARRLRSIEDRIDMWVATPKCAIHLDLLRTKPLRVMGDALDLANQDSVLVRALGTCLP